MASTLILTTQLLESEWVIHRPFPPHVSLLLRPPPKRGLRCLQSIFDSLIGQPHGLQRCCNFRINFYHLALFGFGDLRMLFIEPVNILFDFQARCVAESPLQNESKSNVSSYLIRMIAYICRRTTLPSCPHPSNPSRSRTHGSTPRPESVPRRSPDVSSSDPDHSPSSTIPRPSHCRTCTTRSRRCNRYCGRSRIRCTRPC